MQLKLQYNIGVEMQDNAGQHTGGTVPTMLVAETILNTGKIAKMIHPGFFGEDMVVGILITQARKINDYKLMPLMKIRVIRQSQITNN